MAIDFGINCEIMLVGGWMDEGGEPTFPSISVMK